MQHVHRPLDEGNYNCYEEKWSSVRKVNIRMCLRDKINVSKGKRKSDHCSSKHVFKTIFALVNSSI